MPPPVIPGRVLVVDDDPLFLRVCCTILRRGGLTVEAVSSAAEALERIRANRYDAIVSDIRMPGGDGLTLLRAARAEDATVPFLLMTGAPSLESAISAVDLGALRYLQKPFEVDHFLSVVTEAVALRVGSADRSSLERRLDRALEHVFMVYQPIVRGSTIIAYEALLRSSAPEIAGPLEVLELAERTNRVFDVGRLVRAKVAADLESLDENLLCFVNLHPLDLEDPELASPEAPLVAHAHRVVLEVTERASITHLASLDERLLALRALGFRIAVDDLGSGYAGLTTFARVRPEFVKLDASLVRDIDARSTQRLVVSAVCDLARDLQSVVVAEAIENPRECEALRELGIEVMQGYYFARPAEPWALLREEHRRAA